jgi:AcrR family transcriptional regulator
MARSKLYLTVDRKCKTEAILPVKTSAARQIEEPPAEGRTLSAIKITRAETRRRKVLSAASDLFATKGFEATSMRDVAAAAGIMSGSLYYHFASKEDMYVAVQDTSVSKIFDWVEAAIARFGDPWTGDPWERLEAAAMAHCEALLDRSGFRVLVTPLFPPGLDPRVRQKLVEQRDRFERMIDEVIDALRLPPEINRQVFQKHYLGAINWVGVWYEPGGPLEPREIGRQIVSALKR